LLLLHLRKSGHEAEAADNGAKGLTVARTTLPDLIVLDNMLPGMSGVEVCRTLRECDSTRHIPILMLTARAAEMDRIKGLESGADDYVTKPYSIKELMLRVQAILRRRQPVEVSAQKLTLGPLAIDLATQAVLVADKPERLTSLEFKLLTTLARQAGVPVGRATLLQEVWGYAANTDSRTLDSHVRRLRAKLGEHATMLETVQGTGYRLVL
jgi:two-component system, OmpR family, phosphate regulon response regulator PhoB